MIASLAAALIGQANPGGTPKEVFDGLQAQLAANRAVFYRDLASGPFYGYNRPGAKPSQAIIDNWSRQSLMGGAKAAYDGIAKSFESQNKGVTVTTQNLPTESYAATMGTRVQGGNAPDTFYAEGGTGQAD